jgi:5-amino-6-(D-ribitylamino)uracil---L-tyrosine 4-hydroxyphenyl transferase
MVSDVSDIVAANTSPVHPRADRSELERLWSEPVRLFRLANLLREKSCKTTVSFVVNRNINFTNICIGSCRFCSFKHSDRYFLTMEQILERTADAEKRGATEICLQGGLAPKVVLEDYCAILETIRQDFPRMHLHAYSPMEVMHMSRNSQVEIKECLSELLRSGLGSMPGTAAEVLVDSVRQRICPEKLTTDEWREIIKTAHQLGIPSTSTLLYGHVESLRDRLRHLQILRDIQAETHGFTELVLLPFIPENNLLGTEVRKADLLDHLKMHALARVALYPHITNIQASWTKLGRDVAATALEWGANDLGGTLMDEAIARNASEDPFIQVQDLVALIKERGRRPVQRTTIYERVRSFD